MPPARRSATATLALLLTIAAAACTPQPPPAEQSPRAAPVPAHAAATWDDPEFKKTFRHKFADVDGVRMHYVTGGSGPPVVLLHGWPQTWYGWWPVMPALAKEHTVYAVDLPGLGDSTGSPSGYDKATLARYVHTLVADRSGYRTPASSGTISVPRWRSSTPPSSPPTPNVSAISTCRSPVPRSTRPPTAH